MIVTAFQPNNIANPVNNRFPPKKIVFQPLFRRINNDVLFTQWLLLAFYIVQYTGGRSGLHLCELACANTLPTVVCEKNRGIVCHQSLSILRLGLLFHSI